MIKKSTLAFLLGIITIYAAQANGREDQIQSPVESKPVIQEQKNNKRFMPPTSSRETLPIAWPDYGSLLVDWGFNFLRECPTEMKRVAFDTRSLNFSGHYNIRFGKSHFTTSIGMGTGSEGFSFEEQNNQYSTLIRNQDSRHTEFQDALKALKYPTDKAKVLQSTFSASYWDFLIIEPRFNANKKYPKEGFFVALGGAIGMYWKSSTKINFQDDDEMKVSIDADSNNLQQLRYSLHGRLGWGRFSVFYKHNFSSLFNEHRGPTMTKPSTIGLSIDLF